MIDVYQINFAFSDISPSIDRYYWYGNKKLNRCGVYTSCKRIEKLVWTGLFVFLTPARLVTS